MCYNKYCEALHVQVHKLPHHLTLQLNKGPHVAEYIEQPKEGVAVKNKEKVERPTRFKVLLLNDDYTSMEFVVDILQEIFRKQHDEAVTIMLKVHQNGTGVAGVYVKDIAESKIGEVHRSARDQEFPLRCAIEPE